jgi:hypothetical protein
MVFTIVIVAAGGLVLILQGSFIFIVLYKKIQNKSEEGLVRGFDIDRDGLNYSI